MKKFTIITDATCDLPEKIVKELDVRVIPMEFILDEKVYSGKGDDTISPSALYEGMRQGKKTSTSQIPPQTFSDVFTEELKNEKDILYIGFSSGLSGSYNASASATEELKAIYPERKILLLDSLSGCMGEGLLVYKVAKFAKESGKEIDEIYEYAKGLVLQINQLFTVDDLNHLYKGGRLSKTSAFIGTLLHLKPILNINNDGKIVPIAKVLFRKKSIMALVNKMEENFNKNDNNLIMIAHADCIEDAEYLGKLVKEKFGDIEIVYNYIGTVIGSHTGPGALAIFYVGEGR